MKNNLHDSIKKILLENSGGVKFTQLISDLCEILTQDPEGKMLTKKDDFVEMVEKEIRQDSEFRVLKYVNTDLNREKMFVYLAYDDSQVAFDALKAWWENETRFESSTTKMREHPNYKAIVAMGKPVIPLIIADIQSNPSHLFLTLHDITGENPCPEEHAGDVSLLCADWVQWYGKKHA